MRHEHLIRRLKKLPHKEFLMHGSGRRVRSQRVMPKKPRVVFRNSPELFRKRVYATPVIEIALLYAVIKSDHSAWDWCFIRKDGEIQLYCRVKKEPLVVRNGYIHILSRAEFRKKKVGVIFSSDHPVSVAQTIRVSARIIGWLMKEVHFVRQVPETDELINNLPFRRVRRAV